jgi:hypothetical protein
MRIIKDGRFATKVAMKGDKLQDIEEQEAR